MVQLVIDLVLFTIQTTITIFIELIRQMTVVNHIRSNVH